jgi:hypothetical protein
MLSENPNIPNIEVIIVASPFKVGYRTASIA